TARDALGFAAHDVNLYRYAGNAPTMATDPSGLSRYWGPLHEDVGARMYIDVVVGWPPFAWGSPAYHAAGDITVKGDAFYVFQTIFSAGLWQLVCNAPWGTGE